MAATWTLLNVTNYRMVYQVAGDGTVAAVRTNAELLADADGAPDTTDSPLYGILNATYADQDAMRAAILESDPVRIRIQPRTIVADTTAEINGYSADVDTDAVTATKPELNLQMSDTTGDTIIVEIEYVHSLIR